MMVYPKKLSAKLYPTVLLKKRFSVNIVIKRRDSKNSLVSKTSLTENLLQNVCKIRMWIAFHHVLKNH